MINTIVIRSTYAIGLLLMCQVLVFFSALVDGSIIFYYCASDNAKCDNIVYYLYFSQCSIL